MSKRNTIPKSGFMKKPKLDVKGASLIPQPPQQPQQQQQQVKKKAEYKYAKLKFFSKVNVSELILAPPKQEGNFGTREAILTPEKLRIQICGSKHMITFPIKPSAEAIAALAGKEPGTVPEIGVSFGPRNVVRRPDGKYEIDDKASGGNTVAPLDDRHAALYKFGDELNTKFILPIKEQDPEAKVFHPVRTSDLSRKNSLAQKHFTFHTKLSVAADKKSYSVIFRDIDGTRLSPEEAFKISNGAIVNWYGTLSSRFQGQGTSINIHITRIDFVTRGTAFGEGLELSEIPEGMEYDNAELFLGSNNRKREDVDDDEEEEEGEGAVKKKPRVELEDDPIEGLEAEGGEEDAADEEEEEEEEEDEEPKPPRKKTKLVRPQDDED